MSNQTLTYAQSGVDIDAGNELVERIKPAAKSTHRAGVVAGLGGFGGLFDLKAAGFDDPILVAATDGVGTKLRIAIDTGKLTGIGTDLVAMCVNDLICQGAQPLFFLDYFATGRLSIDAAAEVIGGIAAGCRMAGTALIGGETAEMPGMYAHGDFDLAGFAVGALERGSELPRDVAIGDQLIGLPSSGVHSNGYSLVRRIVEISGNDWFVASPFASGTLGEAFLEPTKIYVDDARAAKDAGGIHAMAHITGGGLTENLPRALAPGQGATVNLDAWELPEIFRWLAKTGGISGPEMLKTFNAGIGLVLIVSKSKADNVVSVLDDRGAQPIHLGEVVEGTGVSYTGTLL